jgi:hypothetical protein
MLTTAQRLSIAAATFACALGASAPANAIFVARICDDLGCAGGNDVIVQDNMAGDTIGMMGAISFSTSAFGYNLLVNTSQSKPVLGSAAAPQIDLTFSATSLGAATNVFLYASDTDFTLNGGVFTLGLGGTNSNESGSVQGRGWGGTSNTEFQFSGANLLASIGPLTGMTFNGIASGAFAPSANPYSLTIGATINRGTAGTSTGDLNLQITPIPEPSTWALMLMGPALIGFVARRRRSSR